MGGSEKLQKKVKGGWRGAVWPGKGVHGPGPRFSGAELSCQTAPIRLDFFRLCHFLNTVL